MSLRLLSLRLPFKKIAYRYASQAQRIWGGVSRLELETPKAVTQNSRRTLTNHYPSPYTKIATYRDGCPFRLIHSCLLLTMQSFTQAYAVLYTVIRCHANAYSKPSGLCGSLRCYSLSCTVAYSSVCGCLFLYVYIRCLPTNNAVAYSGPRINQCYCFEAPTAPLHVLGLNAYIVRPFGHPS